MDKNSHDVSVVVLTYGDYRGLYKTLSSIMVQSCKIDCVIVSDDGSSIDFPRELTKKEWGKIPITWVQQEINLGTVKHMNTIAKMTTGEYIKFIASGDAFFDENSLSKLVEFAKERKSLVATSNALVSSEDLKHGFYLFPGEHRGEMLKKQPYDLFGNLAQGNIVSAAATIYNRDFFKVWGGNDESYQLLEDWPTWLRLVRQGKTIDYLNQTTALYALGGVSSKNINAYLAPNLYKDMLLCYEKEIFPYIDSIPKSQQRVIYYGYNKLSAKTLGAKIKLIMCYPVRATKDFIKCLVKKLIIRV